MKAIKSLLSALALLMGILSVSGQDNLTVLLKDGSELTGYISRQVPGENFTFTTSKALVNLPKSKVKSIRDAYLKSSSLSDEWKEWAKNNDAFDYNSDEENLILSDIVTDNEIISKVRVLEKGAKIRYLEMSPNTYTLNWDTILIVKAPKRSKLMLSGINRRYTLNSGMEYDGQYIEEVPGRTVSLLGDNGIVQVFNTNDVKKDARFKVNPNQSMIEQSDLLDIIRLKNGTQIRGLIFERNYSNGSKITNDYLLIETENGHVQSVNLSDIAEYRKEKNSQFKPIEDIVLKKNTGAINRQVASFITTEDVAGVVTARTDSINIEIKISNPLKIVAEIPMDNLQAQQLKLVRLHKFEDKKAKKLYSGFTYEEMVKNTVLPKSSSTSVNGITRLEYTINGVKGDIYGLFDPINSRVLLFKLID